MIAIKIITNKTFSIIWYFFFIYFSLAKSQHYSDGLIEIFRQYGDHLYRYKLTPWRFIALQSIVRYLFLIR